MQKIQVAKHSKQTASVNPLGLLSTFCYHYPQYTLAQARKLPYKHVALMLQAARKEMANNYLNMTQIAAAPHTKGGKGVGKLIKHFERMQKNG